MTIGERDKLLGLIENIKFRLSKINNPKSEFFMDMDVRRNLDSLKYDIIAFWDILPQFDRVNIPAMLDIYDHLDRMLGAIVNLDYKSFSNYELLISEYLKKIRDEYIHPFGTASYRILNLIKEKGEHVDLIGAYNRLQTALKECSSLRSQVLSSREINNELKEKFDTQLSTLSVETTKIALLQDELEEKEQTFSALEEKLVKQSDELQRELESLLHEKKEGMSLYNELEKKGKVLINLNRELTEGIGVYKNNIKNIESEESKRKSEYEQLNEKIETQNEELQKLIDENKELSISLENSKKELSERAEYLEKLIGKEVGTSLFFTFNERKDELKMPVRVWAGVVGLVAVGLAVFIYFLFLDVDFKTANWGLYVVNGIRLLPIIIVLFFCIRQYQRERNFQEEYAFKSAVAFTIDAYSKQIGDQDKRDDMIIESVAKVYDSPIEKHLSKENIKNRSMLKGIEVVKEAVVETAKDVAEVVKKVK